MNQSATPSVHRLRHGLPGYLILFAPHAFAPQRQYRPSEPPSLRVFSRYLRIPPLHREFHSPLPNSSHSSFDRHPGVEPRAFTTDLLNRLQALYAQ